MINIEQLNFGYRKNAPLFTSLNLSLEQGRIYGLLGKNGAGKSTLLKIMTGLLNSYTGKSEILGKASNERLPVVLEDVFYLPEEFILPDISIDRFLDVNAIFYPNFDKELFDNVMDEFQMKNVGNLHHLSYGQKKKVLICFALATKARILLMDEPTNGLDIPSKSQFRKIIASNLNEEGLMLISTHQVRDLETLIDSVIILDSGNITFAYHTEDISNNLEFGQVRDEVDQVGNVLYTEPTGRGFKTVTKVNMPSDSYIDLELLFNAVIFNSKSLNQAMLNIEKISK